MKSKIKNFIFFIIPLIVDIPFIIFSNEPIPDKIFLGFLLYILLLFLEGLLLMVADM